MSNVITFRTGDIVKLKSGGPDMVIETIDKEDGNIHCVWHDDETKEDKRDIFFSPAPLKKVESA